LTQWLSRTLMPGGVRVRRAAEIKNGKACHDRYSLSLRCRPKPMPPTVAGQASFQTAVSGTA
jgi:hypothetical protein